MKSKGGLWANGGLPFASGIAVEVGGGGGYGGEKGSSVGSL